MANLWFSLLMGIALIQGSFAMSPIPILEEEWESFERMMRDPAYRLPTTTLPRHYEVSLTPYFEVVPSNVAPFTFDGEVTIYLTPTQANIDQIVMHCDDLTISTVTVEYEANDVTQQIATPGQTFVCEMPYAFLRINTNEPLRLDQEYVVKIKFRGNIQAGMRGFYRSWYNDSTGKRWMGTTQFQPGHARQAFPCYDEPGFKATFDITMIREESFSPTISNMPIRESVNLTSGRISETFYTTPVTSTYLLAFIVSHYEVVATNNDTVRPFDIYARDNVGITGEWCLEVGELLLEEMERYTDFPYYTMAANINMKQAAIPDFSAGAMENWGLLTYREANILYDPLNTNHFYKQRIANIVAHEIAHMWFGNLVTCAWWDNLWLNEGFARFYQYFLTNKVAPEQGYATRFVTEQIHTAMLSDSVDSAHALTDTNVNNPTTVSAHFSTITYAKGAAVLRMTQYLLGEDTYVKGLQNYLKARAFQVAEPEDLFQALDGVAIEDNALTAYNGITINNYFKTWSEQAGHPLLTVSINQRTGQMTVTQARWERDSGISSRPSLWHIPVTWTRGGAPEFENLKPSTILTAQATSLQRGSIGFEWVIFNKQQSGFYRINYDPTNWALITQALRGADRTVIHEYNRAQIVDDLFNFARAGVMPYNRALNVLSFLEFETSYAPWLAAVTGFNFVRRRLAHDADNLQKLQDEIIRLSAAVTAHLGYSEVAGGTFMDDMQRMYVMELLCNVGHPQCVASAVQNFQNWRNGQYLPANMRSWVYCQGLRQGSADDFNNFWNRYLAEDLANEKVVMLQNAGCTTNQASLEQYLNAIVSGNDDIREQDYTTALNSAVSGNEVNTMRVFEWLKNNVAQTTATLGSVSTPLSYIAGRLLTEEDIVEFETWVTANRVIIGEASYNTGINGARSARNNLEWSRNRVEELAQYFETGYQEDVITDGQEDSNETDDTDQTDEPDETEEVDGGDDTDSANIAVLSVVTLLVTVAINLTA